MEGGGYFRKKALIKLHYITLHLNFNFLTATGRQMTNSAFGLSIDKISEILGLH